MALADIAAKLAQDPRNRISKVVWGSTNWYSIGVLLGNEGQGGAASFNIMGLKDTNIHFDLGFDGTPAGTFWNLRSSGDDITQGLFNQKFTYFLGTKIQGFGVGGYDEGDAHDGATFYWKFVEGGVSKFDVRFFGNSSLHTPARADIYDGKKFVFPWNFRRNQDSLVHVEATTVGSVNFRFDVTEKTITIT